MPQCKFCPYAFISQAAGKLIVMADDFNGVPNPK